MNCKIFTNIQDMVEYLFSKEIKGDIIAIPPDVDELMNKEEIDDAKLDAPVTKDNAGNFSR